MGEAIAPLARAAKLAENPKEASWCNILQARALVEQEDWDGSMAWYHNSIARMQSMISH